MATRGEGDPDQLTPQQIVRLAAAISMNNMAAIAEGYMAIDDATIKNKKSENKDDAEAFNREIIKIWRNKYSGSYQVKVGELLIGRGPISADSETNCLAYTISADNTGEGRSRFRIFQMGQHQREMPTYYLAKFHRKLHKSEENWTGEGVHPKFYYVDLQHHVE